MGDLVFELYANHNPVNCENFMGLCTGNNSTNTSLVGTKFTTGYPGIVIKGGVNGENLSGEG